MKIKKEEQTKHFVLSKKSSTLKNSIRQIFSSNIINIYNNIDAPLKNYFTKMMIELALFYVVVICCSVAFKSLFIFANATIICLILTGILFFRILKCMEGNICKIDGTCQEVFKPIHKLINKQPFARDYVIIQTQDEKYIKIFNVQPYKIKLNNVLFVYFPQSNIKQINEDTYEINNVYYIYISKSNLYKK